MAGGLLYAGVFLSYEKAPARPSLVKGQADVSRSTHTLSGEERRVVAGQAWRRGSS